MESLDGEYRRISSLAGRINRPNEIESTTEPDWKVCTPCAISTYAVFNLGRAVGNKQRIYCLIYKGSIVLTYCSQPRIFIAVLYVGHLKLPAQDTDFPVWQQNSPHHIMQGKLSNLALTPLKKLIPLTNATISQDLYISTLDISLGKDSNSDERILLCS